MKFGKKLFQAKLLSRLSHKVCRLLSSPVLLHKFTTDGMWDHDQLDKLSTAFNITRLFLSLANFETCKDEPHVTIQMNHFGRTFA